MSKLGLLAAIESVAGVGERIAGVIRVLTTAAQTPGADGTAATAAEVAAAVKRGKAAAKGLEDTADAILARLQAEAHAKPADPA